MLNSCQCAETAHKVPDDSGSCTGTWNWNSCFISPRKQTSRFLFRTIKPLGYYQSGLPPASYKKMKDTVLPYLPTEPFQLWIEIWSVLITILLELVHPATINAMRMHLNSKLFDHYSILNGGYKITAVQILPFFIEELIVLHEIKYDTPIFCQYFLLQLERGIFCDC